MIEQESILWEFGAVKHKDQVAPFRHAILPLERLADDWVPLAAVSNTVLYDPACLEELESFVRVLESSTSLTVSVLAAAASVLARRLNKVLGRIRAEGDFASNCTGHQMQRECWNLGGFHQLGKIIERNRSEIKP